MSVVVQARVDEKLKNEAASVLDEMGLTISEAFRLFLAVCRSIEAKNV